MNSNSTRHISEVPGGVDTGSEASAAQINESIYQDYGSKLRRRNKEPYNCLIWDTVCNKNSQIKNNLTLMLRAPGS